jgi:ribose 5-phosphate isomerase B
MVANKIRGIRCGVCWNVESARLTKEHNNANMIAIGGRMVLEKEAIEIVNTWLNAEFQGGRHQLRIDKIEKTKTS